MWGEGLIRSKPFLFHPPFMKISKCLAQSWKKKTLRASSNRPWGTHGARVWQDSIPASGQTDGVVSEQWQQAHVVGGGRFLSQAVCIQKPPAPKSHRRWAPSPYSPQPHLLKFCSWYSLSLTGQSIRTLPWALNRDRGPGVQSHLLCQHLSG